MSTRGGSEERSMREEGGRSPFGSTVRFEGVDGNSFECKGNDGCELVFQRVC